jgi:hypothetical protein
VAGNDSVILALPIHIRIGVHHRVCKSRQDGRLQLQMLTRRKRFARLVTDPRPLAGAYTNGNALPSDGPPAYRLPGISVLSIWRAVSVMTLPRSGSP